MKALHSCFLLIALTLTTSGFAQDPPVQRDEKQFEASRYFLGEERELLISVNILGPVNKPGQYMIPSETDLISLIAYAGGFREDAKIKDVKIVRRMGDHAKPNIMKINLEKFYTSGDQQLTPPLMPDDTVIIGKKSLVTSGVVADIFRSVAFAAQTIYIVYLISKD